MRSSKTASPSIAWQTRTASSRRSTPAPTCSTPIPMRRDAFLAAAQAALAFREIAITHSRPGPGGGVVCTVGIVNVEPKIVTAVPGVCEISLDQRALDAGVLAAMVQDAGEASERAARENNVTVEWRGLWQIEP